METGLRELDRMLPIRRGLEIRLPILDSCETLLEPRLAIFRPVAHIETRNSPR
jgi:hypothetical protein